MRNLRLALSNLPKVNDPNPTHALHPSKYLHMFCALLSLKTRVIHTSVIWNAKVAPNLLGWLQSSTAASFSMSLMLFGGKFLFEPPTVILFYALGKPVSAEYIFLIIMWKVKWFFKKHGPFFKKSLHWFVTILLQFQVLLLGHNACGILAPWPGTEPTAPALEGKMS